jgi:hypothetical protein
VVLQLATKFEIIAGNSIRLVKAKLEDAIVGVIKVMVK